MQSENLNIPVQKNKYQNKNIYFSTKIFISVPKYIFQSKNIYFSTKIYISIQKYLFQYKKKKSFPKSINISKVSLRPAGRREVSLSKWRIWMDIQNEATTYYFKKLHIRNYISLLWKVLRYQNPKCDANPKNLLTRVWFHVYAGGSGSMGHDFDEDQLIKMLLCCIRRELGGPG